MSRIVAWFAHNSVAANLLMFMMIVAGFMTVSRIPQKPFPDIDIDMVTVGVEYRGAAPQEVEEGVCVRIEEEIEGIDGVDKIRSTATEGSCGVFVEVLAGSDPEKVLSDVKNRVDAIDTFPDEAEKPVIAKVTLRRGVVDIAISGEADERALREFAERIRDEVNALPGVTQTELTFVRPYEISIEVPEESLRRFGLSFDEVVEAVRRSSLDLPGGSIKTEGGEILLRTKGQAYTGEDFERIVVRARRDGTRVTLADIGTVIDGFEDIDLSSSFDGKPAVILQVLRVGDQDAIEISNTIKRYIADAQGRLPAGMTLTAWQDQSQTVRDRLDTLFRNGRGGFILVFIVLALFLRLRLAFWVSLGVPVSILGALALFPSLDLSIDAISTFGFVMVLGILVDDAIVVGDNVYTHQEAHEEGLAAAVIGTQEVSTPVIFGVLTTIAAFCPLLMVPGPMGQVFQVMGTVVILCLSFSLVESMLILPAHLAHGISHKRERARSGLRALWHEQVSLRWRRVQEFFVTGMMRVARELYRPLLERALEWRYAMIAALVGVLVLTIALVASGRISFSFFPPIEADYLAARLVMPQGTPFEATSAATQRLVTAAEKLREELDAEYPPEAGESMIVHVLAAVGSQPFKDRQASGGPGTGGNPASGGAHLAEVVLELVPSDQRAIATSEVATRWRELVGGVPDAVELVFASDLFSVGEAINVQLQGPEVESLQAAADRVKEALAGYPGVIDISDSFRAGKQEIKLAIQPAAEPLGLTMRDLARQVRQAFYGEEAQRIQRGRDDVRVMVRYPEEQRRSVLDLEDSRVRTPDGAEVPFATVADVQLGQGYATIRRSDRQRVVNVTADVDRNLTNANEVLASLRANQLPLILADYPGTSFSLEGSQREQARSLAGLRTGFVIALFAIFALLAIPLRSYSQPLIIMSVIPFGIVGAIGGHLLTGKDLAFMSVIGIVALSGVVVNDSLVMVHYINGRRAVGESVAEAVRSAGVARFRPIILTSLTTFAGLTPLLLERSMQAQFLIPMATSLGFGVLFATIVTLLAVPASYLVLEDLKALLGRRRARRAAPPQGAGQPI